MCYRNRERKTKRKIRSPSHVAERVRRRSASTITNISNINSNITQNVSPSTETPIEKKDASIQPQTEEKKEVQPAKEPLDPKPIFDHTMPFSAGQYRMDLIKIPWNSFL